MLLQDRAKIQTKRRPPSRAARQRAAQTVDDQADFNTTPAPPADPLRKHNTKDTVDTFNKPKVTPPTKAVEKPPLVKHDTDDIFEDSKVPSKPPTAQKNNIVNESKIPPSVKKTVPVVDNDDDIFSDRLPPPDKKPEKSKVVTNDMDDIFTDSRVPPPDNIPEKSRKVANDMEDIFGDSRVPPPMNDVKATSTKPSAKVDMFGNDDLLDDDRVPPPLPTLSDGEDDNSPFSGSMRNNVPQDDFDDLFSATSSLSTKSTGNLPPDLDDIFGDSSVLSQPSSQKNESKTKKKDTPKSKKSSDIPDDDIFADSSVLKPKGTLNKLLFLILCS